MRNLPGRLSAAFAPIYGQPCWLVKKGYGSFLTMEFGEPKLEIADPRPDAKWADRLGTQEVHVRGVAIHGEWHLWVYHCRWFLLWRGQEIASSDSRDQTILQALRLLDGQALIDVDVRADSRSRFEFDLGCTFVTEPIPTEAEEDSVREQWSLYQPDGDVVTVRADGRYSIESEQGRDCQAVWVRLEA